MDSRIVEFIPIGKDKDVLIQKYVMGIEWDETRCRVCGWPLANSVEDGCVPGNCSMRPAPDRRADEPAPYSTDLATAWRVLEKMQSHPRRWLFDDKIGYCHLHTCEARSAAYHICNTALAAVGDFIPDEVLEPYRQRMFDSFRADNQRYHIERVNSMVK